MSDFNISKEHVRIERGLKAEWDRVKAVVRQLALGTPKLFKEMYMVHKILTEAEPYVVNGTAEDNAWVYKNRAFIESYAIDEMRNQGYIPVLDAVGEFMVSFDAESETFNYTLSIPGYKHERASEYAGILSHQGLLIGMNMEKVSVVEL